MDFPWIENYKLYLFKTFPCKNKSIKPEGLACKYKSSQYFLNLLVSVKCEVLKFPT